MRQVNLLIKPASGLCNLRCKYCFYHDLMQHGAGGSGIMGEQTAQLLIDRIFQEQPESISVCFQGGEPTLAGLPYFQAFVQSLQNRKTANQQIHYAIQSNGILIDEHWSEFFSEHRFLVGLSMDGPQSYHDSMRVDAEGKGTLKHVEHTWRILQRYGVDTNILSVVTGQTARHATQIYRYLKALGAEYLQFIACLDPLGKERGRENHSLTPQRYGKFLCALFDCWYADYKRGYYLSIRQFDDWIHNLAGMPVSTCMSTGQCGAYLVIEADGSVYPCDFYVTEEHRLGSIQEMTLEELQIRARGFIRESLVQPEPCKSCKYVRACRGGCKRDRLFEHGVPVENYFCPAYRTLFDYAWERMMEIASAERRANFPRI